MAAKTSLAPKDAVAQNRMITTNEERIRAGIGASILAISVCTFGRGEGLDYGWLAATMAVGACASVSASDFPADHCCLV